MIDGTQFGKLVINYPWGFIEQAKTINRHGRGTAEGGQFAPTGVEGLTGNKYIDDPKAAFKLKEKARVRAAKKAKQLSKMSEDDPNYKKVASELKALTVDKEITLAEFKRVRTVSKKAGYKTDSRGRVVNKKPSNKKPDSNDTEQQVIPKQKTMEELAKEQFEKDSKEVEQAAELRDKQLSKSHDAYAIGMNAQAEAGRLKRSRTYKAEQRAVLRRLSELKKAGKDGTQEYKDASDEFNEIISRQPTLARLARAKIKEAKELEKAAWSEYISSTEEQHGRLMDHYKKEAAQVREKLLSTDITDRAKQLTKEQELAEKKVRQETYEQSYFTKAANKYKKYAKTYEERVAEAETFLLGKGNKFLVPSRRKYMTLDELTPDDIKSVKESIASDVTRYNDVIGKSIKYKEEAAKYKKSAKEAQGKLEAIIKEKELLVPKSLIQVKNPTRVEQVAMANMSKTRQSVIDDGVSDFENLVSGTVFPINSPIGIDTGSGRASATSSIPSVKLPPKADKYTVVHELAHQVEMGNSRVLRDSVDFWQRRTGSDGRNLKVIPGYRYPEVGDPDDFPNVYDGKVYKGRGYKGFSGTEIVSRGLEYMEDNPVEFASKDSDYFDYIYALSRAG